jgi:hypothetical protein
MPVVSALEDRRLLAAAPLPHGAVAVPVVAAQVHDLGKSHLHHNIHTNHATIHPHRALVVHAVHKPSSGTVTGFNPAQFSGTPTSTNTYNTDGGMALPGTNPGGGPTPSGSMNAPYNGMGLPGTNLGGGDTPSGSMDGPTVIPGTSPGGGMEPSGTITGPISP